MVIDNTFNLVIYVLYVVVIIIIAILLLPTLFKKLKEGFSKYRWEKFPKNFVDPYFGSTVLELVIVISFIFFYISWLIYGFFNHRLDEIVRYIT